MTSIVPSVITPSVPLTPFVSVVTSSVPPFSVVVSTTVVVSVVVVSATSVVSVASPPHAISIDNNILVYSPPESCAVSPE